LWDMRYAPLNVPAEYPISAIVGQTAPQPSAPWVMPGKYTVTITIDGKKYSQPLFVKMDPRVKTSTVDLQQLFTVASTCYNDMKALILRFDSVETLLGRIQKSMHANDGKESMKGSMNYFNRTEQLLMEMHSTFGAFKNLFDGFNKADIAPTKESTEATHNTDTVFKKETAAWDTLKKEIYSDKSVQLPK